MRYRLCKEGLLVDVPSASVEERIMDIQVHLVREMNRGERGSFRYGGREKEVVSEREGGEKQGGSVMKVERGQRLYSNREVRRETEIPR